MQYTKVTANRRLARQGDRGTREASKMLFRLSLANIRVGLNILL
ncbi:MAG: hypothetical protein ACLR8Y_08165 [Alistipes indistinctus]